MTIVAGPNGSGKTSLTQHLAGQGIDLGHYINPDDIAAGLVGSETQRSTRAQLMADRQRHTCLERREDFTFETVMSHPSKVAFMRLAKDVGYFVQLIFVGIDDPAVNVDRVRQRVALGGHDVPADRIVARWKRTMELLPEAIRASDRALLFDNSDTIANPGDLLGARPVAECIDGKLARLVTTTPIPAWLRGSLAQISR